MNPDDQGRDPAGLGMQGMFYGAVRISSKGQVVIPQRVREVFGLKEGDQLIVLGRPEQGGFALMKPEAFLTMQQEIARVQAQLGQVRLDGPGSGPADAKTEAGEPGAGKAAS